MHIRTLAFLLFLQSFAACQTNMDSSLTAVASVDLSTKATNLQSPTGTAFNIVFQSADDGLTWQDVSAGLPAIISANRIASIDGQIYVATDRGVFHNTRPPITSSWEEEEFSESDLTDMFQGRSGIYFSSYEKGLYKIIPGTGVSIPLHHGLADKNIYTVFEAPNGALFVGCESGLFKSADSGNTWTKVIETGPVYSIKNSGDVLVCGALEGLMRSTDGGEHWDWTLTDDGQAFKMESTTVGLIAITDGRMSWQETRTKAKANRLRLSTDEGKTWQRLELNLPNNLVIYDIQQAGKYLFCSCDNGVYRTADLGKHWELVREHSGETMIQLAVSGGVLYAVRISGC